MRRFFAVWLIFFCWAPFVFGEKMDKIVAVVNGDIITADELNLFIKMSNIDPDASLKGLDPKELKSTLLNRLIEDRLILQEAKRSQLKIDEAVVEDRIRDIKRRAGGEAPFEEALKSQGVSLTELRQKFRNQLMIYTLIQKEVRSKVNVSPKEIMDYYEANQNQFVSPETVVVDSIFIKDKEALKEAEAALDQGKDFNEVAKSYSQKAGLGSVERGQLKKGLEDVLFSLEIGKRSKPVQVDDGYYIFLVKEKRPVTSKSIEEVKDEIKMKIENAKTEKVLKEWIEGLKDQAYISIRES
jgi:parvulin-like peptidyl-prolyl isomerase